jgi:hypothetical protein
MKNKPTMKRGAAIRSAVIKAHLRRMKVKYQQDIFIVAFIDTLLAWVADCDKRAKEREGGL